MKQEIQKQNKKSKKRSKLSIFSTITLVIQILCVLVIAGMALAPYLTAFFGIFMFFFACVGVIFTTAISAGTFWISEGFRNFWGNTFSWIFKVFESPDVIVDALKPTAIWLSIVLFVVSLAGFIVNLIQFIKRKDNKVRFILSCVFLGIGLINMILCIVSYASLLK